ncbi:Acetyl-CoA-benzylalcohol acetyltransferase [Handroanthus impetiginosus]|uniref:Acetyl-CoA-benzylalcohol acetyltransferase n=1 Tax=Handroanthus impetiginosus TaxID=429701 RepID=A0A2G9I7D6_9LAMI|nr:Acetyl-CoA-benzylalcohol acetyltransferase [Handroanthus impetiginosus]
MKINIVSRKLIKPSKPTPSHLRTYKISVLDELNPSMHVIRILYYQSSTIEGKIINLEDSLAKILPLFYPLAGRYNKEKHQVDCNDEGIEYSVAEVDCQLDQLTGPGVNSEQLNHLLPLEISAVDEPMDPMLGIQINRFQCGGLAIGVCASNRIFDSCSLGIFLTAWANAATNGGLVISPDFDSPTFFPYENLAPVNFEVSRVRDKSIVAKRFVFDKNSILKLRESLRAQWKSKRPPSRVVVVSAALTQALVRADKAKHGIKSRNWFIAQEINVRERTIPPIPKYSCGSWVSISYVEFTSNEIEQNYQEMVLKMRESTIQAVEDCARIFSDKEFGRWVLIDNYVDVMKKAYGNPNDKIVWITDWSKFGDYELDFGFGKPIWVSLADVPFQDLFILMNTRNNDGIEAWAFLHESDMEYLEQDEQLRMLTTK